MKRKQSPGLPKQSPENILKNALTILDSKEFSSELQRLRKFHIQNCPMEMDFKKLLQDNFVARADYQQYPLHIAVFAENIDDIKRLTEDKSTHLNQHATDCGIPLAVACAMENLEMMGLLISLGADLHACHDGLTILYSALRSGNLQVIELLVEHGVKISPRNLEDLALNYVRPTFRGMAIASIKYLFKKFIADQNITLVLQLVCLLWIAGVRDTNLSPLLGHQEIKNIFKAILTNNKILTLYVARFASEERMADCYTFLSAIPDVNGDTLAHHAANHSNHAGLQYFLKNHRDIFSRKNKEGNTPFFLAVASVWESEEMITALMREIPGILTQQADNGEYVSHCAARHGRFKTLKLLIRADPTLLTKQDQNGETPLVLAAKRGQSAIFKFIEAELKEAAAWRGKEGQNIVHMFAQFFDEKEDAPLSELQLCQLELLKYIIERYSPLLTTEDAAGYPPIAWAAGWGQVELIKIFAQQDENLVEWRHRENKRTLVHQAARNGHTNVYNYLKDRTYNGFRIFLLMCVNYGNSDSPLLLAAKKGYLSTVKAILADSKFRINWMGPKGENIFHELIKSYGNDSNGQTPQQKRIQEVFIYFMFNHSDLFISRGDHKGYSPIAYAAGWGSVGPLALLYYKNRPLIQWRHQDSKITLAHQAANYGHLHIIKFLRKICPDLLNATDFFSDSPLFKAIKHDRLNVVQWYQQEVPDIFEAKTIHGNLLHQLASYPTEIEQSLTSSLDQLEDVESKAIPRVQLIDFLIRSLPGGLDEMRGEEKPFDIAVSFKNYYFLACILAIKPDFTRTTSPTGRIANDIIAQGVKNSLPIYWHFRYVINESGCAFSRDILHIIEDYAIECVSPAERIANTIIEQGVRNFLPIYWHFCYAPNESGYAFPLNVLHIIEDYAIERASAFILLSIMENQKEVAVQRWLEHQSLQYYYPRFMQLGQSEKAAAKDDALKMIQAVERNEFYQRYGLQKDVASVGLFGKSRASKNSSGTPEQTRNHKDPTVLIA
jgi:ankyrin repeat protein